MVGGIVGLVVGLVCAVVAIGWTARQNRRAGSSRPLIAALGLGASRSSAGIERVVRAEAARLAFPLYAAFTVTFVWMTAGSSAAGVLAGIAGGLYGLCAAHAGRRFAG